MLIRYSAHARRTGCRRTAEQFTVIPPMFTLYQLPLPSRHRFQSDSRGTVSAFASLPHQKLNEQVPHLYFASFWCVIVGYVIQPHGWPIIFPFFSFSAAWRRRNIAQRSMLDRSSFLKLMLRLSIFVQSTT